MRSQVLYFVVHSTSCSQNLKVQYMACTISGRFVGQLIFVFTFMDFFFFFLNFFLQLQETTNNAAEYAQSWIRQAREATRQGKTLMPI